MSTPNLFGPRLLADGRILFRLWSPSAAKVDLFLTPEGLTRHFPMQRETDNWFSAIIPPPGLLPLGYFFQIDDELKVPDPASRFQLRDVHGPSLRLPSLEKQQYRLWHGRPWEETIIYELHVGTFSEFDIDWEPVKGMSAGEKNHEQLVAQLLENMEDGMIKL